MFCSELGLRPFGFMFNSALSLASIIALLGLIMLRLFKTGITKWREFIYLVIC